MNYRDIIDTDSSVIGVSGFFSASGSFGTLDGSEETLGAQKAAENGYIAEYRDFSVKAEINALENGVFLRQDTLTAKSELTLNRYTSRFLLEGGEYEEYTQFSGWQQESLGGWQNLVTGIEAANGGIRTTDGATPFAVIRNKSNGKMLVFNVSASCAWKIKISKKPYFAMGHAVLVEIGIDDRALSMRILSGEEIFMPKIYFYAADSALDFDAWRIHSVFNRLYPRKRLPIVFNSWMYTFDKISVEDIFRQADVAADWGIEMFLIDAGWFGRTEDWSENIGEWTENLEGGFYGRLYEVSEYIRAKGMTFGLWVEPERALSGTTQVKAHPEYFIRGNDGNYFLNFAREDARGYIFGELSRLIDTYKIGFMKLDFNASIAYDEIGSSFYRYFEGQRKLIADLRAKYPELYITNCASGGTRMELSQQEIFDSVWISDNHGPISGLRIFKETAYRMPPSNIEKWDVRKFCDGFLRYGHPEKVTLPVSCDGAEWKTGVIVNESYTHAFITGGVMGFSGNIAEYPESAGLALKEKISQYKKDRDFYKNAVMRIVHQSDNLNVFQYSDIDLDRIIIQVFCTESYQKGVRVYPVLKDADYLVCDTVHSGAELMSDGILMEIEERGCVQLEMRRK